MATVVTAIFDSPDMAELALHQLRSRNIQIFSFHIQPREDTAQRDIPPAPVIFAPAFQNTVGAFTAPAVMPAPLTAPMFQDTATREVIFTATIPEEEADRVRGMLISAHGRKVR